MANFHRYGKASPLAWQKSAEVLIAINPSVGGMPIAFIAIPHLSEKAP
jgi:hypothetical protein